MLLPGVGTSSVSRRCARKVQKSFHLLDPHGYGKPQAKLMAVMKFGIGQAVTRTEDDPILRGNGRYVADHAPDGALHAVVLRSPHAHARFRITDVATARGMSGVRLVLTAEEVRELG